MSGYFFNPCRCVLFTLKLSYKLAKAHGIWKKAGFGPWNVHRNGKWLIPTPHHSGVPGLVGNDWEELKSFSRPAEMFADQAGFEANLQGWVKWNAVGFGAAVILTFLQSVKNPEPLTYANPLIWYKAGMADAAWIKALVRAQRMTLSCFGLVWFVCLTITFFLAKYLFGQTSDTFLITLFVWTVRGRV